MPLITPQRNGGVNGFTTSTITRGYRRSANVNTNSCYSCYFTNLTSSDGNTNSDLRATLTRCPNRTINETMQCNDNNESNLKAHHVLMRLLNDNYDRQVDNFFFYFFLFFLSVYSFVYFAYDLYSILFECFLINFQMRPTLFTYLIFAFHSIFFILFSVLFLLYCKYAELINDKKSQMEVDTTTAAADDEYKRFNKLMCASPSYLSSFSHRFGEESLSASPSFAFSRIFRCTRSSASDASFASFNTRFKRTTNSKLADLVSKMNLKRLAITLAVISFAVNILIADLRLARFEQQRQDENHLNESQVKAVKVIQESYEKFSIFDILLFVLTF